MSEGRDSEKSGRYLTINEFASLVRASARSLRYYDKIGIFSPVYTDPDTGYRYYSINQIYKLNLVRCCVEEGIPTEEIRAYTQDNGMLEAQKFFKRCLELSSRQYERACATKLKMEAYAREYSEQITDEMVRP